MSRLLRNDQVRDRWNPLSASARINQWWNRHRAGVFVARDRYARPMTGGEGFSAATRAWFDDSFAAPTEAQRRGWDAIARGDHTLIHAPTGSGKTLAAFLWAIDRLSSTPLPEERGRCRVLYVSPMKALAYDIERNLRAPLTGIQLTAERLGSEPVRVTTAMRTGDTPQADRQAMLRHPPDILITTPESLLPQSIPSASTRSTPWRDQSAAHTSA